MTINIFKCEETCNRIASDADGVCITYYQRRLDKTIPLELTFAFAYRNCTTQKLSHDCLSGSTNYFWYWHTSPINDLDPNLSINLNTTLNFIKLCLLFILSTSCVIPTYFLLEQFCIGGHINLPSDFPSVKPASTLPYGSMHPQSIETGILWVAVVLVHSQLHCFVPGPLRLFSQPEGLDWLSGGRVSEVEQGG